MKRLFVIPLSLLFCIPFGCQPAEEAVAEAEVKGLSDNDVATITSSIEAYVQTIKSRDFAAVAAFYTEDAVLMPPNHPEVQGRQAIQSWMEGFPPLQDFNLTALEMDGRGDLAFARGELSMTIAPEEAPEPIIDTGKFIEIRRKQADGSWLIAVDIFNSNLSPPPPPREE